MYVFVCTYHEDEAKKYLEQKGWISEADPDYGVFDYGVFALTPEGIDQATN